MSYGAAGGGDQAVEGAGKPVESPEARLKRMKMRSWRRGTKEMDLILGPFADATLASLPEDDLALYDALLNESDTDLLPWVLGQRPAPLDFADLIARIAAAARGRLQSG